MALLAGDRVVAAALELHELEQRRGDSLVCVGADGELGRRDVGELDPVAATLADAREIEAVVVGERSPSTLVGADVGSEVGDCKVASEWDVAREDGDLRVAREVADLVNADPGLLGGAGGE